MRYGHKFTTCIDGLESLAIDEWGKGLSGVTGDQIKRGLEAWVGEWPPSLPEFRDVCTARGNLPEHIPAKLLSGPEREARIKRGREELVKIKCHLGIKTRNTD